MITFSLPDMVRRAGTRRTSTDIRVIEPTKATVDQLARVYMKAVRAWALIAKERIMPAYARAIERRAARDHIADASNMVTDDATELGGLMGDLGPEMQRLLLTLTPELREWAFSVEKYQRDKWVAGVASASGLDLGMLLTSSDVAATVDDLIAWNVALIKDVSDQAQARIANAVFSGYRARTPSRQVAKQITEALGMSRKRALFVASDQANKLSGALDVERATQSGLTEFTWRHSGKRHPRLWHKARDGKVFKYKNDPEVKNDMPGQAVACGCRAQAKLSL